MLHWGFLLTNLTSLLLAMTLTRDPVMAVKPDDFKYCLYECANCVVLWGKQWYDGTSCAKCCRRTRGLSLDSACKMWIRNRINNENPWCVDM